MTYDVDEAFSTARELVECLLESDAFTPDDVFDAASLGTCGYIFRGHADRRWTLLPSAHRDPAVFAAFTPQPPWQERLRDGEVKGYFGGHLHAELWAVHNFLETADKLGIPTPIDYTTASLHTRLLNDALNQREETDVAEEFPHPRLRASVALAQHHGVPTRLLDWTESRLVAAYFAAAGASAAGNAAAASGARGHATEIAVLCLDLRLLDQLKNIVVVPAPHHGNAFLRAQRGLFTLVADANAFFLEHQRWPSIEDVVRRDRKPNVLYSRPPLIRLSVPATEADEVLRILWRYDVTRHHLMPTLDNAARAFAYADALWGKGRSAPRRPGGAGADPSPTPAAPSVAD